MNRMEYMEILLAQLRRVTPSEREAIRQEIDGHIEDHICSLLELGYDQQLAEERTMARMGDPAEAGRELNQQYPLHWLILSRVAVTLTIILCLQAMLGVGILFHARDSILTRLDPPDDSALDKTYATEEVDLRLGVGNDILHITRVSTGEKNGYHVAEVRLCNYDRIPFGIATENLINHIIPENQRGEARDAFERGGSFGGSFGADEGRLYTDILPGDTYITLRYDAFGEQFDLQIPLPEEVEP